MRWIVLGLVLVSGSAYAQNPSSQKLLSFTEDQRNAVWGELLRHSGEACTRVSRTMLQGAHLIHGDTWSVDCGNADYTVTISSDAKGSTNIMTCGEFAAVNDMLAKRGGGKPDGKMRCWVKWR